MTVLASVLVGPSSGGAKLRSSGAAFDVAAAAGVAIATINDPFGAGSTFAAVGATPAQLQLVGAQVQRGAGAAVAGTPYSLKIRATSADGKREIAETFVFTGSGAAAVAGAGTLDFSNPANSGLI